MKNEPFLLEKRFQWLRCQSGLPDGLFLYQKSLSEKILEGIGMENVVILYDHFEYFTAIWYIL
jgi:hypothetical protein